jgi:putative acyl-CoA dehydrogenase
MNDRDRFAKDRPLSGTHAVFNQATPLAGYNAFDGDTVLREAIARGDAAWVAPQASALGAQVGDERMQGLAHDANRFGPQLKTHDRFGHRIDFVEYHPAYHELMSAGYGHGVHSLAWNSSRGGAFTARAALFFLWNELEQGTACPMTMTFAGIQVLRNSTELTREWEPRILANAYDPRPLPVQQKSGATLGMAMTEKQGGSDLRAVETRA